MKEWSIRVKLTFLCISLLGLLLGVSGMQFYGLKRQTSQLIDVSTVQLPAVRNMALANRMHEKVRAVSFRALYLGANAESDVKKAVMEEFILAAAYLNRHLTMIDRLDVKEKTKEAINQAKPEIRAYIVAAEEMVTLAQVGKKEEAFQKIAALEKSYKDLDARLESLGELIKIDAETSQDEGQQLADLLTKIGGVLILFGLIFGSGLAFWMTRELLRSLNSIIRDLTQASQQVAKSSGETTILAEEISAGSNQQSANLQTTSSSIEQISAMVNQNADSALRAKEAIENNQRVAEEGVNGVSDVLHSIHDIRMTNDQIMSQMETSSQRFGDIVKIISGIGEKTKVINDIVFQTKLLSFNASIEAARAGEHGKGFAVVAEEVGNLAQMSGNAAKEINDMLNGSITQVNEIVKQMTERVDQLIAIGKHKIQTGQSKTEGCRETLERMAENARAVTQLVSEISHASKEQALGIQEINKAISQLSQVTVQNASVALKSSNHADHLNSQAKVLIESIQVLVQLVRGSGAQFAAFVEESNSGTSANRPEDEPKADGNENIASEIKERYGDLENAKVIPFPPPQNKQKRRVG